MSHTISNRKSLVTRLRRIRGQVAALENLLNAEDESVQADCNKVLQQISAIRGATNGLMLEVLDGHLREHLAPNTSSSADQHEDLEQVIKVLRTYLK